MAASRSPARRRQRSVRVTVAVVLLSTATVAVIAALPTQSPLLLSISSVLALLLGWAAVRMMWTEVLQSRREQAVDRAAAAGAYKSLFAERASEHAEFTVAMTERLAEANLQRRELEGALVATERRATDAEERLARDSRRLVETQERVEELEQQLAVRRAEEADALACWEGEGGETVAELVAWDAESTADQRVRQGA